MQKAKKGYVELEELGTRVRSLRKEKGWTLAELSKHSGLAISTISKLERAEISPTYDRFMQLASGLGVEMNRLFSPEGNSPLETSDITVTRAGEAVHHETERYVYDMLCSDKSSKCMTPMLGVIKAHSIRQTEDLIQHQGEEFIYLLEGEIELCLKGREPLRLNQGDSAYFNSGMEHGYVSTSEVDAKILVVCVDKL